MNTIEVVIIYSLLNIILNRCLKVKPPTVPTYFLSGDITHLTISVASFNDVLGLNVLKNDNLCQCGIPKEDSFIFFLENVKYNNRRRILYSSIRHFHPIAMN